jgi:hypothetical protein
VAKSLRSALRKFGANSASTFKQQFFDSLCLEPMEELRPACHMALAVTIGKYGQG